MLYVNNNTCCTHNIQYRLTRQRLRGCSSSSSSWRTVSVMTYTLSPSLTTLESSPVPASLEPFLDELPLILRSIDRDLICSVYVKPAFRIFFSNFIIHSQCFKVLTFKKTYFLTVFLTTPNFSAGLNKFLVLKI